MARENIDTAFILIKPNLTGFKTAVQKSVNDALKDLKLRQVTIPVKAVVSTAGISKELQQTLEKAGGTGSDAGKKRKKELDEEAKARKQKTEADKQVKAVNDELIKQTKKLGSAETALAEITEASIGLTNTSAAAHAELAVAKGVVTKSNRLLELATEAETAALATQDAELIRNAAAFKERALALQTSARAARNERVATLQQIEAQKELDKQAAKSNRTLSQLAGGAKASAFSFVGLRGAVLAASGPFLAASAGALALAKALSLTTSLETQLNVFQATTGATAEQMERVSDAARELGADLTLPAVSAGDAATAMVQLSRAGLSVQDSIEGARGVLQLGTAAAIDNAAAVELAASALNAFGLGGEEAIRVADVLANAANQAQGSISDMGVALQQSAAVARQVGLSLENTSAILTLLARNGLRGSDAGTSLRTALIRLIAPSREAQKILNTLGLTIRDAQGNVRPEIFAEFGQATADLSETVRDQLTAEVFGQDAIRAVAIAAREGAGGLREMQEAMGETGSAAELAEAQTKGLAGAMEGLKSNLETAATTIFSPLLPALTLLVETLTGVVSGATKATQAVKDLVGLLPPAPAGSGVLGNLAKEALTFAGGPIQFYSRAAELIKDIGDESEKTSEAVRKIEFPTVLDPGALSPSASQERAAKLGRSIAADLKKAMDTSLPDAVRNSAFDAVDAAVEGLRRLGPTGAPVLEEQAGLLADAFGLALREAVADFTGFEDLVPTTIPPAILDMIKNLKRLGPQGQAELRALGESLSKAMAEGVKDGSSDVRDAREALNDAIAEGNERLLDSIRDARENLASLGESLGNQIEKVIDAGPIGQRIERLNDQLDDLEDRVSGRSLQEKLRKAQSDLAGATAEFRLIGPTTARQQQAVADALEPLKVEAKNAQDEITKFGIEGQIERQEELKEQAVETAQEGIAKLVEQFDKGKISADQFAKLLRGRLAGALEIVKRNGKNLGLSFTQDFLGTVEGLVKQAEALTGFVSTPGTAPGEQPVRPGDVAAENRRRVEEARQRVAEALQAQKDTAKNTKQMADLLAKVLRAGGRPPVGDVRTPGSSIGTNSNLAGQRP